MLSLYGPVDMYQFCDLAEREPKSIRKEISRKPHPHDSKTRTTPPICCRQTGHERSRALRASAHCTHMALWPQGVSTASFRASMQTQHRSWPATCMACCSICSLESRPQDCSSNAKNSERDEASMRLTHEQPRLREYGTRSIVSTTQPGRVSLLTPLSSPCSLPLPPFITQFLLHKQKRSQF